MQAIIDVTLLPPRLADKRCVSLLSRYGMWALSPAESFEMTVPRVISEVLIAFASVSTRPVAPVLLRRSDPAKSTKLMVDVRTAAVGSESQSASSFDSADEEGEVAKRRFISTRKRT